MSKEGNKFLMRVVTGHFAQEPLCKIFDEGEETSIQVFISISQKLKLNYFELQS